MQVQSASLNLGLVFPARDVLQSQRPTLYRSKRTSMDLIFANRAKWMAVQISGNDAVALAAFESGAGSKLTAQRKIFFAGYPITPSSEILRRVAQYIHRFSGDFLQMEDEIASIGAVIGASRGGAKAFTATSGPGFSLKQENLGYACLNEIPIVVVNVQRAGPSTGGPTKSGQGDILQSRWGTHGDHPIIVIAPYSAEESYYETHRAFNLAEQYLNPVIILSDGTVGQTEEEVILPPTGFVPIIDRQNSEGRFHTTGLYTGPNRLPTKNPEVSGAQLQRILTKLTTNDAKKDILKTDQFLIEDPKRNDLAAGNAKIVVISFGITARAAEEAVLRARQQGIRAGLLRPITIWPSDEETIKKVLSNAKTVIVAELNCGQYIDEIKRLGYEMALRYQKVPPQIVGLNIIEGRRTASTSLISTDEILNRINEFKGEV